MFELLKRFNAGQVLTNVEIILLRNYLVEFELSANERLAYFSEVELDLIVHGTRMYLYSVNQVIRARNLKA